MEAVLREQVEVEIEDSNSQTVVSSKPELDEDGRLALLQALLFACGEPLGMELMTHVTGLDEETIQGMLVTLESKLAVSDSGIELVCVASKYQLRTKSIFAPFLRDLKSGGPRKLSAPALETLSIIAYRQPIVKSDIEKIRGVDATPTLKTLIERNLINIIGHQATVGQPALYGTTEEFLKLFGLSSLSQLPTLRDLNEFAADPGESGENVESDETDQAEEVLEESQEVAAVPEDTELEEAR